MNVKEAREMITQFKRSRYILGDVHPNTKAYILVEGFLEGYTQASKAAEPLLVEMKNVIEILEFIKEADLLPMAFAMEGGREIRDAASEAISSSAHVVENYRKEVLGE